MRESAFFPRESRCTEVCYRNLIYGRGYGKIEDAVAAGIMSPLEIFDASLHVRIGCEAVIFSRVVIEPRSERVPCLRVKIFSKGRFHCFTHQSTESALVHCCPGSAEYAGVGGQQAVPIQP